MLKKRKFVIGGLVILLAIAYLGYRGYAAGSTFYLEVDELLQQSVTIGQSATQVRGKVIPGTIRQEALSLRFSITDFETGQGTIPVVYKGVVPDTFKADAEVVVEGYLDTNGVFQARKLMPKCPSRYVPA